MYLINAANVKAPVLTKRQKEEWTKEFWVLLAYHLQFNKRYIFVLTICCYDAY